MTWKTLRASLTWKVNKVLTNFPLSYQVEIFYAASVGQYLQVIFSDFWISNFLSISPKFTLDLENCTCNHNLVREQGFNQFPTVVTSWNFYAGFVGQYLQAFYSYTWISNFLSNFEFSKRALTGLGYFSRWWPEAINGTMIISLPIIVSSWNWTLRS